MPEHGNVKRIGEESGMPGDAAHNGSVFVIHFALNDAHAELPIIHGGRDFALPFGGRAIASGVHAKRRKNLALAEAVKRFARETRQQFAEHDETYVAVTRELHWRFGKRRGSRRAG